jgi:hypothetical protein
MPIVPAAGRRKSASSRKKMWKIPNRNVSFQGNPFGRMTFKSKLRQYPKEGVMKELLQKVLSLRIRSLREASLWRMKSQNDPFGQSDTMNIDGKRDCFVPI